jgi:hypothetical protein
MWAKCGRNLVYGQQKIPRNALWTSIACSVMKDGYEQRTIPSTPIWDEEPLE